MDVPLNNMNHALANNCTDPDCEIHVPTCIEDRAERLTAMAWFYAGACALFDTINDAEPHHRRALITLTEAIKEVD